MKIETSNMYGVLELWILYVMMFCLSLSVVHLPGLHNELGVRQLCPQSIPYT